MTAVSAGTGVPAPTDTRGETVSYHGQPILKAPVWSREIPNYLFVGGLAGASATLAYTAELSGAEELGRRAWLTASAGIMLCPPLLIIDLGRPERFLNMLRMFKVTSPMSMGSWILSVSGTTTAVAGFNLLSGRLAVPALVARPVGGVFGLLLATYTAALFADTAVPAWHEARHELPFVFGAGAALSAAGAISAATPVHQAAPARRLAVGAAAAELASTAVMERRLGLHAEAYGHGRARALKWVSRGCVAAGAGLLATAGARSRPAAVAGGALACAGALATRWSVFEAGRASAADPRYVVEPQRARMAARAAHIAQ
jgi:formate-dependent nitrite reductase membrane component NrfD